MLTRKQREKLVGRKALWHAKLRRQEVLVPVEVTDVVERFGRVDCEVVVINTLTGEQESKAWVSTDTLDFIEDDDEERGPRRLLA